MEMDRKSWEGKCSDIVMYEINQQLESQRLEVSQANQWADQAQMENRRTIEELNMKNRIYQAYHARDCQETEELRRIWFKQAERVRQCGELSMHTKENPSIVNQLFVSKSGTTGLGELIP